MLNDSFEELNKMLDMMEGSFIEISVKQHQIDFLFKKDNPIQLNDLNKIKVLLKKFHKIGQSYIVVFDDEIHFVIPEIEVKDGLEPHIFMKVIYKLAQEICSCPSLEFVISPFYLKCYLDKPGLLVEDLDKYDNILGDKGTLELHTQRPYLLYLYYNNNGEQND